MHLEAYLQETHELATPDQWAAVRSSLPQGWIEKALQATGVTTLRKRRWPMEQAMWLVLGIALLRDRSILHVADALEIALPGEAVSTRALSQARQRQGSEPLASRCTTRAGRSNWPTEKSRPPCCARR
jgi:hypothetical protein